MTKLMMKSNAGKPRCPLCNSPKLDTYDYSGTSIRYCKNCYYEEVMDFLENEED